MKNQTSEEIMTVEVAYAVPDKQLILPVKVLSGITAKDAIKISGILDEFPEIDLVTDKIGIFGKIADLNTVLNPMDRVEIYRPLIADPKKTRRERAFKGSKGRVQT